MIGDLPPGWHPTASGAEGPCPFCFGTDRCWIRGTAGNLRASCSHCRAASADILNAVGDIAFDVRPPRRSEPLSADIIEFCRSLPPVAGAGLAYLRGRRLWPTSDVRWLPVERWSTSPIAWALTPTKRTGNLETPAAHGYPLAVMAGAIVYLWRDIELQVVGVQIEGVLRDGHSVPYRRRNGRTPKRFMLNGSQAKGAAFVARPLGWPDDPLHIAEGEPDALMLAAHVSGGVIAAHGGNMIPSLAPWCHGKHVTIWPDGDQPGENGARKLRDALLDDGQPVNVRFGPDDVCDRGVHHG